METARACRGIAVAIDMLLAQAPTVQDAARTMLAAWDANFAHPDLGLAACFAGEAYAKAMPSDAAPAALMRAFLTALIDPLSESLDYLRAEPASGAIARAAQHTEARHEA